MSFFIVFSSEATLEFEMPVCPSVCEKRNGGNVNLSASYEDEFFVKITKPMSLKFWIKIHMANDKFLYYAVNNDFILLPYIFQFREFVQPLLISMYII